MSRWFVKQEEKSIDVKKGISHHLHNAEKHTTIAKTKWMGY